MIKKAGVKVLARYLEALHIDFECHYAKQAEVIFKLFFDIISSRDNTLSKADGLETRKALLNASLRLLANSK